MSLSPRPTKLTLCLLRLKGKPSVGVQWTTSESIEVLGNSHPLFEHNQADTYFVDSQHAQLYFENESWHIKNISQKYSLSVDDQLLAFDASLRLKHDAIVELGLYQLKVLDHAHLEMTQQLKQLLLVGGTAEVDHSSKDGLLLKNTDDGRDLKIGASPMIEKTTFEDMGLGVHFDEQQFFKEIQSESAHIRTLQTTAKKESLDILDQLAIESEIAIINPSLLNKKTDYWDNALEKDSTPSTPIPELAHLFALKDYQEGYMVPLDNLEHINALLANKDNIDKVIGRLDNADDYALFADEQRVEPLRLFSLENHDIREYAVLSTPEFTQKEHHSSSMDGYFNAPSVKAEGRRSKTVEQKSNDHEDDWLNNFGAALNDKVSGDDILDSLIKKSN